MPWPDGPTSPANLIALCRRHHRLKQSPGWTVAIHPDLTVTWTDPVGRPHQLSERPPRPHRRLEVPARQRRCRARSRRDHTHPGRVERGRDQPTRSTPHPTACRLSGGKNRPDWTSPRAGRSPV
ncbi:MAG TPA: hypothetical protein PKH97_14690 [Tetrasphaera sp.]|uniref:hypothetical protein n=1 Tax=Nostocoides sp. TaxID=1917966 RepID=UPI002C72F732|nr:hypothetical protein [Tetrasphaera sp.]HNQ08421.1 hypothetical protein [Tetrasphaera sp.]